jgi:CRISPR/Cas system CMR-associated protein Cmr5 small subunit
MNNTKQTNFLFLLLIGFVFLNKAQTLNENQKFLISLDYDKTSTTILLDYLTQNNINIQKLNGNYFFNIDSNFISFDKFLSNHFPRNGNSKETHKFEGLRKFLEIAQIQSHSINTVGEIRDSNGVKTIWSGGYNNQAYSMIHTEGIMKIHHFYLSEKVKILEKEIEILKEGMKKILKQKSPFNLSTYTNQTNGFEIKFPLTWSVQETRFNGLYPALKITKPGSKTYGMIVIVRPAGGKKLSRKTFLKKNFESIRLYKDEQEYKIVTKHQEKRSISGFIYTRYDLDALSIDHRESYYKELSRKYFL